MDDSKIIYYNNLEKEIIPIIPESDVPEGVKYCLPETRFIVPGIYEIGNKKYYALQRPGSYEVTQNFAGIERTTTYCVLKVLSAEVVLEHSLRAVEYRSRADRAGLKDVFMQAEPLVHDCLPLDMVNVMMNVFNYPIRYLYMYSKSKNKVVNTFVEVWLGIHKIEKWQMFDIDSGFVFADKRFIDLINNKSNAADVFKEGRRIAKDNHRQDLPCREAIQTDYHRMAELLATDDIVLVYADTPDAIKIFTEDRELLKLKDPAWIKDVEAVFAGQRLEYVDISIVFYELYEKKTIYIYAAKVVEANISKKNEEIL